MPRHDPAPPNPQPWLPPQLSFDPDRRYPKRRDLKNVVRCRRPPKGDGGEPVPVDPRRPLDLTGGAAAALEFDD